ncbi:AHH domain-containing protein [Pyxidicoccus xibeiensis]|uniref:AHH domain-containing protein n=1 Tax=Pyxidicoccus xibeiensis TaxID=2906759 RepID=UPI0020A701BF|nr:AHH domain-containing protein [Pyxidicoccus xibeiensis]MCP3136718.1 AHH domain-containing protein [Pyxidicoccus xibeiensis]
MVLRWLTWLMMLSVASGCATSRVVRLDTGAGEVITFHPRTDEFEPVELEEDEFIEAVAAEARMKRAPLRLQEAARRLFAMDARSGTYDFDTRTRRFTPVEGGAPLESDLPETDVALTRAYLRWCERTQREGDCLKLLEEGPTLNGDGRYALAMGLAMGVVNEEMMEGFKDMADPEAMFAAVMWTGTMYFLLVSLREPVSKGVAAVMTATLVVYLGVDTFWGLITGFRRLVEEADRARTFDELRDAGERYGKVMGRNAARAFALLATVALGNTAAGFAGRVPRLPGSAQASVQSGSQLGISLTGVGELQTVTVTGEAITVGLAPSAVLATANGLGGAGLEPVEAKGHDHHIATNKWTKDINTEGPWTPKFQRIFDRAGMSLNDRANIVKVKGHQGPHPLEYHKQVFRRLDEATVRCRTMQTCRDALTEELHRLARQISTPGTSLNKLVTRSE